MTDRIQTGDYQIYVPRGEVRFGDEIISIRPKTFELLLLLLEARGELVSKQEILKKVWDDVAVDEQVVFQSVKELRKVFQNADPIKTVPRKGYAWTLPIAPAAEQTTETTRTRRDNISTKRLGAILSMAFALIIAVSIVFWEAGTTAHPTGSVIVLPVKSQLNDTDHRWVRYGAMDHLIHRLPPADSFGTYQTVDVLDVLKRADVSGETVSRADIEKIFAVTGASLIVELTLAGTPREYQLLYTLHERSGAAKGVVLSDRVNGAVDSLAATIGHRMGLPSILDGNEYRTEFANELMASALEQMQSDNFAAAIELLEAAIATEPGNIAAKRLLIQNLVRQNSTAKVKAVIASAIPQAETAANKHEFVRLNFWAGVNEVVDGEYEAGLMYLERAAAKANDIKDWLYLGYVAEMKGHIRRATGDYAEARTWYETALQHHQIIECPYGQAQGLLNLARISLDMGDLSGATEKTEASLVVIEERELASMREEAQRWKKTLTEFAQQPAG